MGGCERHKFDDVKGLYEGHGAHEEHGEDHHEAEESHPAHGVTAPEEKHPAKAEKAPTGSPRDVGL